MFDLSSLFSKDSFMRVLLFINILFFCLILVVFLDSNSFRFIKLIRTAEEIKQLDQLIKIKEIALKDPVTKEIFYNLANDIHIKKQEPFPSFEKKHSTIYRLYQFRKVVIVFILWLFLSFMFLVDRNFSAFWMCCFLGLISIFLSFICRETTITEELDGIIFFFISPILVLFFASKLKSSSQ